MKKLIAITLCVIFTLTISAQEREKSDYEKYIESQEQMQTTEPVWEVVEDMPKFNDKEGAEFRKWIALNVEYPRKAKEEGIEGTVIIQFVVNKDGFVTDIKVKESIHELLDAEAIRVIKISPKWTPGYQDGTAVNVRYTFPISFVIKRKYKDYDLGPLSDNYDLSLRHSLYFDTYYSPWYYSYNYYRGYNWYMWNPYYYGYTGYYGCYYPHPIYYPTHRYYHRLGPNYSGSALGRNYNYGYYQNGYKQTNAYGDVRTANYTPKSDYKNRHPSVNKMATTRTNTNVTRKSYSPTYSPIRQKTTYVNSYNRPSQRTTSYNRSNTTNRSTNSYNRSSQPTRSSTSYTRSSQPSRSQSSYSRSSSPSRSQSSYSRSSSPSRSASRSSSSRR